MQNLIFNAYECRTMGGKLQPRNIGLTRCRVDDQTIEMRE